MAPFLPTDWVFKSETQAGAAAMLEAGCVALEKKKSKIWLNFNGTD